MYTQVLRSFLPIAVVFASAVELSAADVKAQPTSQLLVVTTVKIKPGTAKEWEAIQSDITNAYQKAGVAFRNVWQTATLGDLYTYSTVSPISKFADLDGDSPLLKSLGKESADKLTARLAAVTESAHRMVIRSRPDLSIGEMTTLPTTPVELVRIKVAPGRTADYENLLKTEFLPAAKKGGTEVASVYQLALGGVGPEYHAVIVMNKFADFDGPGPLVKALGKEGAAKLSAKFAGITLSSETSMMRGRPDLSYTLKTDKAAASGE